MENYKWVDAYDVKNLHHRIVCLMKVVGLSEISAERARAFCLILSLDKLHGKQHEKGIKERLDELNVRDRLRVYMLANQLFLGCKHDYILKNFSMTVSDTEIKEFLK